jgi:maltooligosyltrehalose trehalohydrolase
MEIGSRYLGDRNCTFTVWAPHLQQVAVHIVAPKEQIVPLQCDDEGYWHGTLEAEPGTLYFYQLDGKIDWPDPASRSQPKGVHGPSEVVDQTSFTWMDQQWAGIPLSQMIIYELHVGTFTPAGTFEAVIPRIPELLELGVNTIELMPVAQFPGERNWGYDGVYPFGIQHSYGGVNGLKQLVNACHQQGMAVVMDVVYNHIGPEGNYFGNYAPYYTERFRTPWGNAINYDDAYSYGVRNFFIENALSWFRDYHIDSLRLDASDNICDFGAKHFLQELAEETDAFSRQQGRKFYLVAETDLNAVRFIRPVSTGGYGLDGQWKDDFHHALHALLTGEREGYYEDFGDLEHLAKAFTGNFVYSWTYSRHRNRYHGSDATECPPSQFVVCSQNHDQVGNRLLGERLAHLVSFEASKLAAAAMLLSPCVPLLFMGEEYGEEAPFQYFVSHSDPELVAAVRKGRREEFAAFHGEGEAPDPQSEETFRRSKLHWEKRHEGKHRQLWRFYQTLLRLRTQIPALANLDTNSLEVAVLPEEKLLKLRRWYENSQVLCLFNFSQQPVQTSLTLPPATWKKLLSSADAEWGGPGSDLPEVIPTERENASQQLTIHPESVVVYGSA